MAVVIETELGIEPSGRMGTVLGRMFAKGNLSKIDGGWRRLQLGMLTNLAGSAFDEQGNHVSFSYTKNRWFGTETEHGTDRPAFFAAMQAPLSSGVGTNNYGGVPWNLHVFGDVGESGVLMWGRDVQADLSGPFVQGKRRLQLSNSANNVEVAVLVWGMIQ